MDGGSCPYRKGRKSFVLDYFLFLTHTCTHTCTQTDTPIFLTAFLFLLPFFLVFHVAKQSETKHIWVIWKVACSWLWGSWFFIFFPAVQTFHSTTPMWFHFATFNFKTQKFYCLAQNSNQTSVIFSDQQYFPCASLNSQGPNDSVRVGLKDQFTLQANVQKELISSYLKGGKRSNEAEPHWDDSRDSLPLWLPDWGKKKPTHTHTNQFARL